MKSIKQKLAVVTKMNKLAVVALRWLKSLYAT